VQAPDWFGLFPFRSPLLWESRLISLRRATEMFQFAHGPRHPLCIQGCVSSHHAGRVAPFGLSRLIARMQLPLNVSPVSASFFGLMRPGIHLVLSLACDSCSLAQITLASRRHARVSHVLASASQLAALGKIEKILVRVCLFRFFSCSTYTLSRKDPNNWNVESHQNPHRVSSPSCSSVSHQASSGCPEEDRPGMATR
jgi:hypothetical protein